MSSSDPPARDEWHAGRIETGLAADLTVLSGDPTAVPPEAWAAGEDSIEVVATLVDGIPILGADVLGYA